jgi:hypothetical protein
MRRVTKILQKSGAISAGNVSSGKALTSHAGNTCDVDSNRIGVIIALNPKVVKIY